jgi:hypothetical protein
MFAPILIIEIEIAFVLLLVSPPLTLSLSLSHSLSHSEAGFLVRVNPDPCLILSRNQIRALLCSSK